MSSEAEQQQPKKTLVQKLCEVGQELTWVEKRGENKFHGYKYATEADLVMAIRLELYERHVFLVPHVLETKRENIERKTVKDGKEKITSTAITDMMIRWTWVDGDTGETLESNIPGCGEDSGDKGTYKAITGSEKYLLLKTFLIPTYDDAEAMTPSDKKKLQGQVAEQRIAQLEAKKQAQTAQSEDDAEKILKKAKIMYIDAPDRFHGEFAAVYGEPIFDETLRAFFNDCLAGRFKGPEGVFFKLDIRYAKEVKGAAEKLGYTVKGDWVE